MKTIGDKIETFAVTGVKPGALTPDGAFETITEKSFEVQMEGNCLLSKGLYICMSNLKLLPTTS